MHTGLLHAHSALRWLGLIFLVAAIIDSGVRMKRPMKEGGPKFALFALIVMHSQLVLGLLLYFVSPTVSAFRAAGDVMKNAVARFYVVEHLAMMILAIVILTIGYSKGKRAADEATKHRRIFYGYLIALILILISIPWPFREVGAGRGWF
ncbi:MAG: hypothetical protein RLZZ262_1632 [Bacteroidota bacterium]|jgi:hypothetical protein